MDIPNLTQYIVIGFSFALFIAVILSLTLPPDRTKRLLRAIAVSTVLASLGLYGYGYQSVNPGQPLTNILRTTFATCRIFVVSNDWGTIKEAFQNIPGESFFTFIFWLIHFLAMVTSAGAVVTSLGHRLLRQIRMRLFRQRQTIALIYGLNDNTLSFGKELMATSDATVVYVDPDNQITLHTMVNQMGSLVRSDSDALQANKTFLKSLGIKPGDRKLQVYALSPSPIANLQYAKALLYAIDNGEKEESKNKKGSKKISPDQITLTILGNEDYTDHPLQNTKDRFGYSSIISLNEPEMVARILMKEYPPSKQLKFNKYGCAESDFHAVIIGCGHIGQAVLRHLIMNGQFLKYVPNPKEGKSHYQPRTSIFALFAPNHEQRTGWLYHDCLRMQDKYTIDPHTCDGRSKELFQYIEKHFDTINYIAICTGNEIINLEIAEQLQSFLKHRKAFLEHEKPIAPIFMCTNKGIYHYTEKNELEFHGIYTPDLLCSTDIDARAIVLNHYYKQNKGDAMENWRNASYFDKLSSRAAADFYDTLIHCANKTKEEVLKGWNPSDELLEGLAITEHLRWNAFHFCHGFQVMTNEEFEKRVKVYKAEKAKDPNTEYRVAKNLEGRTHACLIPWDDLDAYAEKENKKTDDNRNYKNNDYQNIKALQEILQIVDNQKKKESAE